MDLLDQEYDEEQDLWLVKANQELSSIEETINQAVQSIRQFVHSCQGTITS